MSSLEWQEERRKRAYEMVQNGWPQKKVAEALGVSEGAVSQWMKRAREGGVTPSNTAGCRQQIECGTIRPITKHPGTRSRSVWICGSSLDARSRAASHPGRVWGKLPCGSHALLAEEDRLEQPETDAARGRARRGTDCAVDSELAQGRKKARQRGQTLVFADEAGFKLLSGVVATYAPRGHTPVLRVPLKYDRLSTMGAISNAGHFFTWLQDHAIKGPDLVRFLKHILAHIPGKVLLVWDGLPAHRSQPVKDFLASGAAKRLTLLQLPPYAPELNPQEGIWRYLKYVELANVCCRNLAELRLELRQAIQRVRYRLHVIVGCLQHAQVNFRP